MDDPRLTHELERRIFLLAFYANFNDIQNLILTAKRVHQWLLPHVFSTVIFGGVRPFPTLFTLSKFRTHGSLIRSLSLSVPPFQPNVESVFASYISRCPNISNLSVRTAITLALPLQSALLLIPNLTRLTIHIKAIFSTPPASPLLLQHLTNLTHLHLDGQFLLSYTNPTPTLRPYFPNLTHIAFFYRQDLLPIRMATQGWDSLRVLALWYNPNNPDDEPHDDSGLLRGLGDGEGEGEGEGSFHPGLVVVCSNLIQQWGDGARGRGQDLWEFAESVIRLRSKDGSGV